MADLQIYMPSRDHAECVLGTCDCITRKFAPVYKGHKPVLTGKNIFNVPVRKKEITVRQFYY